MTTSTKPVAIWRTIFELSSMTNNQELVVHTLERIPSMSELGIGTDTSPISNVVAVYQEYAEAIYKIAGVKLNVSVWTLPRRQFSRQVLPEELVQGLDPRFQGQTQWNEDESKDEKAPEITQIIDALTKMLEQVSGLSTIMTPEKALIHFLSYDFYDCMSGGSSVWALAMVRELVDHYKIDHTLEVYPANKEHEEKTGRGWYNLEDFLEEIKTIPRLELHKYLPAGLPTPPSATVEKQGKLV